MRATPAGGRRGGRVESFPPASSRPGQSDAIPLAESDEMGVGPTGSLALEAEGAPLIAGEMRETFLSNGIHVLSESIPGVRSVTAGVWVCQGSAHEPLDECGSSHLLEHLVFKGTRSRGPREIALALERLGGSLDAFTSREHTSYQARILSKHLPFALEVLADLVLHPLLRDDDLAREREVVLEEISGVEDTPDDLVFDLHGEALWQDHPYGRPILGNRTSVANANASVLRDLHRARYRGGKLIVAAAGHLNHDGFVEDVQKHFGEVEGGPAPGVPDPTHEARGHLIRASREGSQTHLVFGVRTPGRADPSRFPLILLSTAFGGGMGSRLFQRIREELGLAYSVYSFQAFHSRAGVAGVYLGTRPEWSERATDAVREEYRAIRWEGLRETELQEVKDQVKGQVMLSLESTSARLFRLAGFALYDQPYLTLDELLRQIQAVTWQEVADIAERTFDPDRQVVFQLGPEDS